MIHNPKTVLDTQAQNGKLAQCYILLGPKGSGRKKVAKDFLETNSSGNSLVFELDGASTGVEQVRELIYFLSLRPRQGQLQAVILDNAQDLNISSFNSLLKTIEEPRPGAVIFLLASRLSLPPTVLSRSQVLRFVGQADQKNDICTYEQFVQMNSVSRLAQLLEVFESEKEDPALLLTSWAKQARSLPGNMALHRSLTAISEGFIRLKQNANKKMLAQYLARNI